MSLLRQSAPDSWTKSKNLKRLALLLATFCSLPETMAITVFNAGIINMY
jgi:hypothetical protein